MLNNIYINIPKDLEKKLFYVWLRKNNDKETLE